MADILGSLSAALAIASRLKTISDHVRDAEFKKLLADLNMELAEAKMKMVDLVEESARLKERVRELEKVEGDRCPKCHKMAWQLESSRADSTFGDLGVKQRTYKCSACGFAETEMQR